MVVFFYRRWKKPPVDEKLCQEGGLRLHKIVSNNSDFMTKFPSENLA